METTQRNSPKKRLRILSFSNYLKHKKSRRYTIPHIEFSKRIRWLRELNNWTQLYVAACLHIDRSTYAYYETGKTEPSLNTLCRLARIYQVSVGFLLGTERVNESHSFYNELKNK